MVQLDRPGMSHRRTSGWRIADMSLFAAIVVTVFLRRWAVYILVPLIILYGWAAWYNLYGYEVYYPRLLQILEHLGI